MRGMGKLELGQEVKRLREDRGLRQSDLGQQAHISNIERGTVAPDAATLARIAAALCVEVAHFAPFGGAHNRSAPRRTRRQRAAAPDRSNIEQAASELSEGALQPEAQAPTVGPPVNSPGAISRHDPFGGQAMLRRIGENGYTTVSLFARVLDLYRDDELAVCQAVEACLRDIELNGVQPRPKGRRHSGGA
jgi:transcriptional regulator with XRE-family HTH domain